MKKKITISDGSAAETGLLLALTLSAAFTGIFLYPAFGSVFAIAIVKQCFEGLGYNFINPRSRRGVPRSVLADGHDHLDDAGRRRLLGTPHAALKYAEKGSC
jgi:hypothetical protein